MFKRFCKAEIKLLRWLLKLLWSWDYSLLFFASSFHSFPTHVCEGRSQALEMCCLLSHMNYNTCIKTGGSMYKFNLL